MSKVITTPVGQAVWPKLVIPDTKFNPDGVFSCKIHVSEEDYNKFRAQLDPLYEQEYQKHCVAKGKDSLKKAAQPCKITDEGDYEIMGKQNAKLTTKEGETLEVTIPLYDADVKPITDEPRIGSGSKVKMSVQPYFWFVPAIGFGYTLRLKAVQILELVTFDGGSHGFSKESGFTQGESFDEVIVEDAAESPNF